MTSVELIETAIDMRPQLMMRARELCGWHAELDAEDLVQDVYVVLVAKPPEPREPAQLKNWLRTVMLRQHIDARRRRRDQVPKVSLELLRGW